MFIDSHAHLDDERFDEDRDLVINNLKDNGIDIAVNIGADLQSSINSVELSKKYENIYAAVGIHPHSADEADGKTLEKIKELADNEKVVAIGEIGLDYYYDNSPRDKQRECFKAHLELAKELNLPVVIHSREAAQETFDIIEEAQDGTLRGVMHCYSGSVEMAEEYINKLGFYISIGGPVTFKNARVVKEVAQSVPLDKLLIETDCPYLTPEPYRGKRNEPMYVKYTAAEIANLRGITVEELAEATSRNARKLFQLRIKD